MICDTCIHKEVCYENEEDRQALKLCADYFNFEEELEKIKDKIKALYEFEEIDGITYERIGVYCVDVIEILDKEMSELKGENK